MEDMVVVEEEEKKEEVVEVSEDDDGDDSDGSNHEWFGGLSWETDMWADSKRNTACQACDQAKLGVLNKKNFLRNAKAVGWNLLPLKCYVLSGVYF